MKRILINVGTLLLTVSCLISLTFAWWISGSLGDGVVIRSAKISSIITIEKGQDFNNDGNLDLDNLGEPIYEVVDKTNKGTEQVLVLDFGTIIPSEVFTWKITVLNKGDVSGYVYATLFEEIDFTDGLSKEEELLKYMSISTVITDGDKVTINKKYFNGLNSETILFGGTDNELVERDQSIQIEFKITFETFDALLDAGICGEQDYVEYQALQGKKMPESFKFLDISLSSYKPEELIY